MCGILGYFNKRNISREEFGAFRKALSSLHHRGPDGEGGVLINMKEGGEEPIRTRDTPQGINEGVDEQDVPDNEFDLVLGHRRLSIFDLSIQGHQPMRDEGGNWIIHNGEIFNFPELKETLVKKGHRFRSETDTEVILAAYREWGADCLNHFNGMWSFVIWDAREKGLFVANDRFGIKPLYWAEKDGQVVLASEVKTFAYFPELRGEVDHGVIRDFVEEGRLDHDDRTFYQGVKRFSPGHWAFFRPGEPMSMNRYWRESVPENPPKSPEKAIETFGSLFEDAVSLRMRSDVPYGVSLSGGLDSGAVTYKVDHLLKERGSNKKVHAFGAIFPGRPGDESEYIRWIQKDLGIEGHYTEPMEEFSMEDLQRMIYHQDAPLPSTSFYAQWCVMRMASRAGHKVLLGGQGADELFAGYHHHFYKYARDLLLGGKLGRYFDEVRQYTRLKNKNKGEVHRIVLNDIKLLIELAFGRYRDDRLFRTWAGAGLKRSLSLDFSSYMLPYYLHSDDRTSMAFGVETRLPFMDYRLVRFAQGLPEQFKIREGWQKWVVREGVPEMPDPIRYRKDKKGFTTPQQQWVWENIDSFVNALENAEELGFSVDRDLIRNEPEKFVDRTFRISTLGIWNAVGKGVS